MTRHSPVGVSRCSDPGEQSDVTAWRRRRLLDAGFAGGAAYRLAISWAIDLHELLELVDRGCTPGLAVRILTPIEDGDPPA